jgi:mRNA interferase MazF
VNSRSRTRPTTAATAHVADTQRRPPADSVSFARCDQVRVVSTQRLVRCRGNVAPDEMHTVERALRFILDL